MSRSSETPKEPDWYQLALVEIARIPDFKGKEAKLAHEVSKMISESKVEHFKFWFQRYLSFGRKRLTLSVVTRGSEVETLASTYLHTADQRDKADHETTIIYLAAKLIMQNEATKKGFPVQYELNTEHPNIEQWATNGKGAALFAWKEIEQEEDHISFKTVFTPQS